MLCCGAGGGLVYLAGQMVGVVDPRAGGARDTGTADRVCGPTDGVSKMSSSPNQSL